MGFTPISQISARSTLNTGIKTTGSPDLDRDDFLRLLVAQLEHQDPLNPADPQEFAAQLAQFSSLEQMMNINKNLQTLTMLQASINNAQAVSIVGHEIKAVGRSISLKGGQASKIDFNLAGNAQTVQIQITDSSGVLVRTMDLGARQSGAQECQWDGRDNAGNVAADGSYTYAITASDSQGAPVAADTYTTGVVTGVVFKDGVTNLDLGGQLIALADVLEIH